MSRTRSRALFVMCIAFLVLFGASIAVSWVQHRRLLASAVNCRANLSAIAWGIQCYIEKHGSAPPVVVLGPDGRPWHSWRILLLESLDRNLFTQYRMTEPWDGPQNRQLLEAIPQCYQCPNHPRVGTDVFTHYLAVIGKSSVSPHLICSNNRTMEIVVIETDRFDVPWMCPFDLTQDDIENGLYRPGSHDPNGPAILLDNLQILR